jgi:hypothetical protein
MHAIRATGYFLLALSAAQASASDFTLAPVFDSGAFTYYWGVNIGSAAAESNPPLFLARGQTYSFTVNTSISHPFYFKTINSTTSANAYSTGVSATLPVTSATPFTFDVPLDAPDLLFYNCGVHSSMAGAIEVVVFRNGFGD